MIDSTDSADPNAAPPLDGDRVPLWRARTRAWSLLNFVYAMCLVSIDYTPPLRFRFDVLPDELGFALFAFAAWRLRTEAAAFSIAQWSAIAALLGIVASRFVTDASDTWSLAIEVVEYCGEGFAVAIAAIGCARLAARYDAVAIALFARRAGIALLGLTALLLVGGKVLGHYFPTGLWAIGLCRFGSYIACGVAFSRLAGRVERDVRSLARPPRRAPTMAP